MQGLDRRQGSTGDAVVDTLLDALRDRVRGVLATEFVGMYVGGSLALDAFDGASDVDVVIATQSDVRPWLTALDNAHVELAREFASCATELECIYMPQAGLRRFERDRSAHLKLDRGWGEVLKIDVMDESWVVHCHVLRTRGITWDGPDPATLIDEVSRTDLQVAMRAILRGWAAELLHHPSHLGAPGYQSYTVLTICRMLHTLAAGAVVSKTSAAEWAATNLPAAWRGLIVQAVADRVRDRVRASDSAIRQTTSFIEYARTSVGIASG